MTKTWTTIAETDEFGEIMIPLPLAFVREYDWREGDRIQFKVKDDSVIIENLSVKERKSE
jgi:bifunctional DNA-binding transcriptional regulator/antitoxin component of YhaV-PrlF toxin-antitoxin module